MYLKQFAMLGYRTLVFGERYITQEEYEQVHKQYQEAIQSVDRAKKLNELAISLEEDLTLLGCTAIEDSLQDGVVDMVKKCLQVRIKVWMITGDKLETAENIGSMAGIIDPQMSISYLDDQITKENFKQASVRILEEIRLSKEKKMRTGLIVDMRSLGKTTTKPRG